MRGFEPLTSSLPRKRSTPELHRLISSMFKVVFTILNLSTLNPSRAGDEARTRDLQLGRLPLYQLSYARIQVIANILLALSSKWGEQDSNLRRHTPADLQSAPVGHFGISPNIKKQKPCPCQLSVFSNRSAKVSAFLIYSNIFVKRYLYTIFTLSYPRDWFGKIIANARLFLHF